MYDSGTLLIFCILVPMFKGILIGAVGAALAGALAAYALIAAGVLPANADGAPGRLEQWAARKSLRATLRRAAPRGPVPVPLNDEGLRAAVRLYAADCAVCHGAADGRPSHIAGGFYQKPPQLARDGVEDDPEGRTFWVVSHGIRLTGMPAFGKSLSETEVWQLALLLKHMDSLPPVVDKAWKAVPSQAPAAGL